MVEHLIANNPFPRQRLLRLLEMPYIKITNAYVADLARGNQLFHCAHCVGNGMRSAPPMQKIHIEVVCTQPLQARITCPKRALIRSVRWKDFTDNENLVPILVNRFTYDF